MCVLKSKLAVEGNGNNHMLQKYASIEIEVGSEIKRFYGSYIVEIACDW